MQLIISNLTTGQKEWLRMKALSEGITMTALVKNWINKSMVKDANGMIKNMGGAAIRN